MVIFIVCERISITESQLNKAGCHYNFMALAGPIIGSTADRPDKISSVAFLLRVEIQLEYLYNSVKLTF